MVASVYIPTLPKSPGSFNFQPKPPCWSDGMFGRPPHSGLQTGRRGRFPLRPVKGRNRGFEVRNPRFGGRLRPRFPISPKACKISSVRPFLTPQLCERMRPIFFMVSLTTPGLFAITPISFSGSLSSHFSSISFSGSLRSFFVNFMLWFSPLIFRQFHSLVLSAHFSSISFSGSLRSFFVLAHSFVPFPYDVPPFGCGNCV